MGGQARGPEPDAIFPGQSLTRALQELQARGLELIFTSRVVGPELRVEAVPAEANTRKLLDGLLAAHGLEAREGVGGALVVVPADRSRSADSAGLSGVVLSRATGRAEPGVQVVLVGLTGSSESGNSTSSGRSAATSTLTDEAGKFGFSDLTPGRLTLEFRRRGFVVRELPDVEVGLGTNLAVTVLLDPAPIAEDSIVVTPSKISLLRRDPITPVAVNREQLTALPQLGGDFFRALSLLPGIAANDVSAAFHVRGARRDATQIVLDGQELYEGFHLQDFDRALSLIAPGVLDNVELSTGGFGASHGDRLAGVLDMTTRTPAGAIRSQIGLDVLSLQLGAAGASDSGQTAWLAQGRRGTADLARKIVGDERPEYWDLFAKIDRQTSPGTSLRGNLLHAEDSFHLAETNADGEKGFRTAYETSYLWTTLQRLLGDSLLVDSALSWSRIRRDRNGFELDEDVRFDVGDRRDTDVLAARQSWHLQQRSGPELRWGFDLRRFDTAYDYAADFAFDSPLAEIRANGPEGSIAIAGTLEERQDSAFLIYRWHPTTALALETGLRYDRAGQTGQSLLQPRLNLAYSAGSEVLWRAAWGRFAQSQRTYELDIADGVTTFAPIERAEHRVLGFEKRFRPRRARPLTLRVEAYQRTVDDPRPRFENLYEPINEFQEVEPDRVLIRPRSSRAEGLELFLQGGLGRRLDWWINYALADTEDVLFDGLRVPRAFDQTHTLNLDLDYRIGPAWTVNLAWRYHTGWPTTPLTLVAELPDGDEDDEAEFLPRLGLPFSERLPAYHRLDVRVTRRWKPSERTSLLAFLDVQNAYDRDNVAGFDYGIDEELGILDAEPEHWTGLFPSIGVRITF